MTDGAAVSMVARSASPEVEMVGFAVAKGTPSATPAMTAFRDFQSEQERRQLGRQRPIRFSVTPDWIRVSLLNLVDAN